MAMWIKFNNEPVMLSEEDLLIRDRRRRETSSTKKTQNDVQILTKRCSDETIHNADQKPCFNKGTVLQDANVKLLPAKKLRNFVWTESPTPHPIRRRAILNKYPEIEELYGSDPWLVIDLFKFCFRQIVPMLATVFVQFLMAFYVSRSKLSTMRYILLTFCFSGTLNHSLFAAMHECSHQLVLSGRILSDIMCIITTIPMGVPAGIPFKRYHLDHHIYMGVTGLDPDLPTIYEANFFTSFPRKLLWILFLPATYSLRPLIMRPKNVGCIPLLLPKGWSIYDTFIILMDVISWITAFMVDFLVLKFWGWRSLAYLLVGTFFCMNFHPFAGHFISEHFIFPETDAYQETNSYYGMWNYLTYNLGYHVEHHDFPRIPGSRLPQVKKIAKEFYDMPEHYGWFRIMWAFLLTPVMIPYNRIHREGIRGGPLCKENQDYKLHDGTYPCGGEKRYWPDMKALECSK